MVDIKNSPPPPPEEVLYEHHIHNCRNLKESVEATTQKAVESIDKLNLKDELDLAALRSESNVFVRNINEIIDEIRTFLHHVNVGTTAEQDLLAITHKLVQIAYSVSNSYNDEPSKLQFALKASVEGVSIEADTFFKLIESGALKKRRQHYLDALNELVSAVDRVRVRNKIIHLSPEEVSELVTKSYDEVTAATEKLTSENDHLLSAIIHYGHIRGQRTHKVIHYLYKHAQHYDEHLGKEILHYSREIHRMLNIVQGVNHSPHSVRHLTVTISTNLGAGGKYIAELPLHLKRKDIEDIRSVTETVYNTCSEVIVILDQFARGLKIAECLN